MKETSRVLVVDDEQEALAFAAGILEGEGSVEVRAARGTREAMPVAADMRPDLILLPCAEVPKWARFLAKVKDDDSFPTPVLLAVTNGEPVAGIEACLGAGADDAIGRDLCPALLARRIHALVGSRRLQEDLAAERERHDLTRTHAEHRFEEMTAVCLKDLDVRVPGAKERATEARAIVQFMTDRLDLPPDRGKKLEFAALFHEIGKVGLPEGLARKHYRAMSGPEKAPYHQYATIGAGIVNSSRSCWQSADAVYHQLENYDGSGFPDGLMGEELSRGARILRAIVLYDELRRRATRRRRSSRRRAGPCTPSLTRGSPTCSWSTCPARRRRAATVTRSTSGWTS